MKRAIQCGWCKRKFVPRRVGATYCSAACRAKAYRHAHPQEPRRKLERKTCQWCGQTFLSSSQKATFCTLSHKTLNNRALRNDLPRAVSLAAGISENAARDQLEIQGTRRLRAWLEDRGYRYNPRARRWEED